MAPLTTDERRGAAFRFERRGTEFFAGFICSVGFIHCEGALDPDSARALAAAFDKGGAEGVTRLYRRDDLPDAQCWVRAPGWRLAYR